MLLGVTQYVVPEVDNACLNCPGRVGSGNDSSSDAPVTAPVDFRNRRREIAFFLFIIERLIIFLSLKLPHVEGARSRVHSV